VFEAKAISIYRRLYPHYLRTLQKDWLLALLQNL
jgi:hypothetical protein